MAAAQRNIIGCHVEVAELEAVAYALVEQIEGEAVAYSIVSTPEFRSRLVVGKASFCVF